MKTITCRESIPQECQSIYTYDKKGNPMEIAGEMCIVECVCGHCGDNSNDD